MSALINIISSPIANTDTLAYTCENANGTILTSINVCNKASATETVSIFLKKENGQIGYIIKNGTLAGNPNFTALSTYSCFVWDTAATTVTYSTGEQLIATFQLGDTGNFDHHFGNGSFNAEELTLQPGEWLTLAAKASTGTPSYVNGSINTREDQ